MRNISQSGGLCRLLLAISMSAGVTAVSFVTTASPATAARTDTRKMTCEQGRNFIRQNGAVVMTTGTHTYARIVSGTGFCDGDEETELKVVPTLDSPRCRIGYICRARIIDHDPLWRLLQ